MKKPRISPINHNHFPVANERTNEGLRKQKFPLVSQSDSVVVRVKINRKNPSSLFFKKIVVKL